MDINEIKSYLEENQDNEEVKQLRGSLMPSFDTALQNPDFEKKVRSFADSYANKQVDAYKEKGFKTAVENEITKRLEAQKHKDPWQIKFEEMELKQSELMNKLQDKELAEMRANNKANVVPSIADYKLPPELIDLLVSEESEKTERNINMLKEAFDNYTQSLKQDSIKGNNIRVPGKTNVAAGNFEKYSDAELYDLVRTEPGQKQAVLSEIKRRTKA